MKSCQCSRLLNRDLLRRAPLPAVAALFMLLALLVGARAALAETTQAAVPGVAGVANVANVADVAEGITRALTPAPARYVLVKVMGTGATQQEAELDAFKAARAIAAKRYAALGGEQALLPAPDGQRFASLHHFPQMGFASPRVLALVELTLRGTAHDQAPLPQLKARLEHGVLTLTAAQACEAVAAVDKGPDQEPELLPGGSGSFRLLPGKPQQSPLPGVEPHSVRVLACTGGLSVPVNPSTIAEAFTKSRAGHPRPGKEQGIISECVELPLGSGGGSRSMRQKSSQSPVNMTGAAGREAGLPDSGRQLP